MGEAKRKFVKKSERVCPVGHRWCNLCGDDCKEHLRTGAIPCRACKGKGYWNADDIRAYHVLAPSVCKASCGEKHRDPHPSSFVGGPTFEEWMAEIDALLARARRVLEGKG